MFTLCFVKVIGFALILSFSIEQLYRYFGLPLLPCDVVPIILVSVTITGTSQQILIKSFGDLKAPVIIFVEGGLSEMVAYLSFHDPNFLFDTNIHI